MKTRPYLQFAFVIATAYFGSTACVARECTGEEAAEVGATGADECETLTLPEPHESDSETETLDYASGMGLRITGDFRNLEVERGSAGEIEVVYKARVDLAEGRSQKVIDATLAELDVSVSDTGDDIAVVAERSGNSNVAALIQVRIPDDFDGDIVIRQGNSKNDGGEVELSSVGSARSLEVDLPSTGDQLTLATPNTLRSAVINVDGFWDIVTGAFSSSELVGATLTTDSGDIKTGFSVVPLSQAVRVLSEDGDITVALPGEGDYTMQAASSEFSFDARIPPSCEEATNSGGGSLTCGAGSEDMEFDFQFESEGAITVDLFLESTQ